MAGRHSSRQALVDRVFRRCLLERDVRTLDGIREAVREELKAVRLRTGAMLFAEQGASGDEVADWEPTDHELQIAISRNCMGDGEWEFYPAYSSPPRYVSRRRVLGLTQLVEAGHASEQQRAQLREMLADLRSGVEHWKAKHARARQKAVELHELEVDVTNRAFAGHLGSLL